MKKTEFKTNTVLLSMLKTLSFKEMQSLLEYLESPIFNKNKRVTHLFNLLFASHPTFEALSKEALFEKIFPEKTQYENNTFHALVSVLTQLVKDFFAYLEYEKNKAYKDFWLLRSLMGRRVNNVYTQTKNLLHKRNYFPPKDLSQLYGKFLLSQIDNRFQTINNKREQGNDSLQQTMDDLDNYYLVSKLKYALSVFAWEKIANVKYKQFLLPEILQSHRFKSFKDIPILYIYYQSVLLITNFEEDEHFYKLKEYLLEHIDAISIYESRQIYYSMFNYTSQKSSLGKLEFLNEIFEVSRVFLEKKILFVQGFLSPHLFYKLVTIAIKINEFEWAEQFIAENTQFIDKRYRDNVVKHNELLKCFALKDLKGAQKLLDKIRRSKKYKFDYYYQLYYRTLLAQTHFESDNFEATESTLKAFIAYLRRQKDIIPQTKFMEYYNFVQLLEGLAMYSTEQHIMSRKEKMNKKRYFTETLANTNPLAERLWFQNIINSMFKNVPILA